MVHFSATYNNESREEQTTLLLLQAVKMYAAGNQIEVLPTADQVAISVNNRTVTSPQEGYQHPSTGSNYVFRWVQQNNKMHAGW